VTAVGTPRPARFPGFSTLAQVRHWDAATVAAVASRCGRAPDVRFFTPEEEAIANALCDQLLHLGSDRTVAVVNMIDARLAEDETDGWHYEDMPEDAAAWRQSLAALDADAAGAHGRGFAELAPADQAKLIQVVQDCGAREWHGLNAAHVWSLWTRYACTAFYSHPAAWDEIGFPGPAYPRGYKNPGVDAREPFEVRDAQPSRDPVRRDGA
jgi:Gluconate 2-dehydrogenase subunit 3